MTTCFKVQIKSTLQMYDNYSENLGFTYVHSVGYILVALVALIGNNLVLLLLGCILYVFLRLASIVTICQYRPFTGITDTRLKL